MYVEVVLGGSFVAVFARVLALGDAFELLANGVAGMVCSGRTFMLFGAGIDCGLGASPLFCSGVPERGDGCADILSLNE